MYLENPNEVMFIPLMKGLREIKQIILTHLDENSKEIKILRDTTLYLQLKEK